MTSYLTQAEFKIRTVMPPEFVDALDSQQPGYVDSQIAQVSGWLDSRLAKRYSVPFDAPYPEQVKTWATSLVTMRLWIRRGFDPNDPQMQLVIADSQSAETEVKEAADGQLGLIDLSRSDRKASLVSRGNTLVYSETSPYVGGDVQRQRAQIEDRRRRGT
jgi:hypothetical protein